MNWTWIRRHRISIQTEALSRSVILLACPARGSQGQPHWSCPSERHGSASPQCAWALAKEYPSQFYAPFQKENYELCFGCHSEDLVLTKETSDLTDFRNGDLNLHYLHVNKERRGRTCRSCHATHASNLPNHVRESVPYGTWSLPIGFNKKSSGGSCTPGCHLPKDYDRKNPVDYSAWPAGSG